MNHIALRISILLFYFFAFITVSAQQLPQYSQYMLNYYLVNPAVVGTTDHYDIKAGFRKQWANIDGAPNTIYVTGSGHVGKDHSRLRGLHRNQNTWHHGIGFQLVGDITGPLSTYSFQGTYAYDMNLTKDVRISFGASLGIKQFGIDASKIRLSEGPDEVPNVALGNLNRTLPDLGAGIWVYHKLFYFGASANQLLMSSFGTKTIFSQPTNGYKITNRLAQHYFITGGALFHPGRFIAIIPSVLLKTVYGTSKVSFDINTKVRYSLNTKVPNINMFWVGTSYRYQDAMVFMAGFLYNNTFEFGYSYDYTISSYLNSYSYGSHEIMLGYRLHPKAQVISPSDFW